MSICAACGGLDGRHAAGCGAMRGYVVGGRVGVDVTAAEPRRPSGMTRLTDVDCPRCGGGAEQCTYPCPTCHDTGRVSLSVYTDYVMAEGKRES